MREKDAGREGGRDGGREGRCRAHPEDSVRRADRQMGEGLRWWGGGGRHGLAAGSAARLKGLPLLGTEGTGRLWPPSSEGREGLGDAALTAVLEYISPS